MAGANSTTRATDPIDTSAPQTAPRLSIAPSYTAPDGSVYVHQDLVKVTDPWAVESHIAPIKVSETFGDVESWVAYVTRFGGAPDDRGDGVLLTWSKERLKATLDYHGNNGTPDRATWMATHPFERTRQWIAWERLANNRPLSQRDLIEALEDHGADVKTPPAGDLLGLVKKLRGTVNATADAAIDENGVTSLSYSRNTETSLKLEPLITIAIPILKGHTAPDEGGKIGPVTYEIDVRIRVSVVDGGKVEFRLSMPNAEQSLEDAIEDRVATAKTLLGDLGATLLRSTAS